MQVGSTLAIPSRRQDLLGSILRNLGCLFGERGGLLDEDGRVERLHLQLEVVVQFCSQVVVVLNGLPSLDLVEEQSELETLRVRTSDHLRRNAVEELGLTYPQQLAVLQSR
jgi:hypothetical protein